MEEKQRKWEWKSAREDGKMVVKEMKERGRRERKKIERKGVEQCEEK